MGVHTPWQLYPSGQPTPHAPQLALSKFRFVQIPPQSVSPGGHSLHSPPLQWGVDPPQTLPQAPQFSGSDHNGVQAPSPQSSAPSTQPEAHVPETQATDSYGPGAAHASPQLPQLRTSVPRSAQWPPQQAFPRALQLFPQAPQFGSCSGSLHAPRQLAVEQQT